MQLQSEWKGLEYKSTVLSEIVGKLDLYLHVVSVGLVSTESALLISNLKSTGMQRVEVQKWQAQSTCVRGAIVLALRRHGPLLALLENNYYKCL